MSLSTEQQCFFIALLAFIVIGFIRGWRRELVSLVFVLLAVFLVSPSTSKSFGDFLFRIPGFISYLLSGQPGTTTPNESANFFATSVGALIMFVVVVGLGYFIGNRVFPKPSQPHDRFIGIVPAIISGAFIISYLTNYVPKNGAGQPNITLNMSLLDPTNYIPIIFAIAVLALVIALIAARAKKSPAKK